ncbi:sugar ABC transporter permease, partial [Streptomyces sviceus]
MSSETTTKSPEAAAVPPSGPAPVKRVPQGHKRLLTRRDRITLAFMAGVPTVLHVALVW